MSFTQWLKRQRYRDDPTGDIARDAANDKNWPRGKRYSTYLRYFANLRVSAAAMKALESAWLEYEAVVRGK